MGAVYRETYTKPLPDEAELSTREGKRLARWQDGRGHKRTVRLLCEAGTYTAKYRNGLGQLVKVATGFRTLDAAWAVLVKLETRAQMPHMARQMQEWIDGVR